MTTIHTAYVEATVLSNHRTARGAAVALMDDLRTRLERNGSTNLTDPEHAVLVDTILEQGIVNLNQGASMTKCALPEERMTRLSFLINRQFKVEEVPLLD